MNETGLVNNQMRLSQNYFSALARGGIQSAITHSATNRFAFKQYVDTVYFSSSPPKMRVPSSGNNKDLFHGQMLGENINILNENRCIAKPENNFSSTKKTNQQQLFQIDSNRENNTVSQQNILNQKRLQSLMSGNDLQPLEEEISKEEDDSVIIKVNIKKNESKLSGIQNSIKIMQEVKCKPNNSRHRKKSSNKSNPYFPPQPQSTYTQNSQSHRNSNYNQQDQANNSSQILTNNQRSSQSSMDQLRQLSHEINQQSNSSFPFQNQINSNVGSSHSLLKANSLKTCSSIISGDFNYNSQMEEAIMYDFIKLSEDENRAAPKIFDPQFQQSYETSAHKNYQQQHLLMLASQSNGGYSDPTTKDNTLSQSQNTSKDQLLIQQNTNSNSDVFMNQKQVIDFNQMQKEKAKQIIESLKAQQQNKQSQHSHSSSQNKVEKRLFDYQKKLEEKIEFQRRLKEQQELQMLRAVPHITEKSNEILMRRSMMIGLPATSSNSAQTNSAAFSPRVDSGSPSKIQYIQPLSNHMFSQPIEKSVYQAQPQVLFQNYQVEPRVYYEELKRKEEVRLKILQEKEMEGFTGKPIINKKSQVIKRKVDDLIEWKDVQDKKRQEEFKKKNQQEQDELQQMQSHRVVNKHSEKIIETRFRGQRSNEKVEDRLLRDASLRKKKQEKERANSQQKQIFYISDLEEKKRKNGSQNIPRARSRSQNNKDKNNSKIKIDGFNKNSTQKIQQSHKLENDSKNQRQSALLGLNQDLPIFSQSVDCQNAYYGQVSPSSNNYMLNSNSNNLQSPFCQSNKSNFSTNLNNFQTSNLINPQSETSQNQGYPSLQYLDKQNPSQFQSQMVNQQFSFHNNPTQKPNYHVQNNNGSNSFDINQFQFTHPQTANPFSPQRLYTQQVQGLRGQNINFMHQNQLQFGQASQNSSQQNYPMQQISYINTSQSNPQQSLMMKQNLQNSQFNNNSNTSQKIQMVSQINDLSSQLQTPNQGSFIAQTSLQNNLTGTLANKNQDKHAQSIKPENIKGKINKQVSSKHQQNIKKATGYVSLFDKVQRMNISENSDQESCNSQQSLPIVSAQMPLFNQVQNQYNTEGIQNVRQIDYLNDCVVNPIYQQIQQESFRNQDFTMNNTLTQQNFLQTQGSIPNISTINFIDPSSTMITYPAMTTQENQINQTIQTNLPDAIHTQIQQYAIHQKVNEIPYNTALQQDQNITLHPTMTHNSQWQGTYHNHPNSQDHIINKILDNSFIPSGNVNQTRRISSRGGGSQENNLEGTTFALSQYTLECLQPFGMTSCQRPQTNQDFHDVFAEEVNAFSPKDYMQTMKNPNLQIIDNDFNSNQMIVGSQITQGGAGSRSSKNRFTYDNGQILDTEFIITNTSRDSEPQNIVRNLNQVLSQDHTEKKQAPKNMRSQSDNCRNGQNFQQRGSQSPNRQSEKSGQGSSVNNLKNLKFMDRNSQWLENKRHRLEKKRLEQEQQQDKQCPFKPQIQVLIVNAEKVNSQSGSNTNHSKSHTRGGSSASQERFVKTASQSLTSRDISKKRNSVEREVQVELLSDPFKGQERHSQPMLCLEDISNQASVIKKAKNNDELSTSMKQQKLLNSNTTDKRSIQSNTPIQNNYYNQTTNFKQSNLEQKRALLIDENDLDISGQCDITNLSPDPHVRRRDLEESDFETSFQSSHGQDKFQQSQNNQSQRGVSLVKVINKRNIPF